MLSNDLSGFESEAVRPLC